VIRLQPRCNRRGEIGRVADDLLRAEPDLSVTMSSASLEAGDVHAAPVHLEVAVPHQLARLRREAAKPSR